MRRLLLWVGVLLLVGCSAGKPTPTVPEWSKSSNAVVCLGLLALEQPLPALPPALEVGKAEQAGVRGWLGQLSLKPDRIEEGQTTDGGFHFIEADFGRLRLVYYLARRGGFEGKLVYMTAIVLADGEADPLRPQIDQVFGAAGPTEKLTVTTDEGREVTELDVAVWKLPLGVLTERNVVDDDENRTVCVLELWVAPAYGQERPHL